MHDRVDAVERMWIEASPRRIPPRFVGPARRSTHERPHRIASRAERLRESSTDQTRRTGDENQHGEANLGPATRGSKTRRSRAFVGEPGYSPAPMEISFVSAESNPCETRGTLPVAALAKGLRGLGHRVTLVAPGTANVDSLPYSLARRLSKLVVEVGDESIALDVRSGRTPQGLELVFLGNAEQMGEDDTAFDGEDEATARRLALFAKGAARYVSESGAEAVHGLGLAGAVALADLPGEDSTSVRILGIDDAHHTGRFPIALERLFGFGADARDFHHLVLLRAGVLAADAVVVPSAAVGRSLASDEQSPALARAIAQHAGAIHAIAPGLDGAAWNPVTDPSLASRFDPVDRSGKARCATALCKELGLPVRADAPVLAVTLDPRLHAPIEGALEAVRAALRLDATVVVQTNGDADALDDLAERWADRLVVRRTDDEGFLHRLLGAADLWLVGRDDAASSTLVLAGLRYGAVPLISASHPMADRLVDCEATLKTGNAFLADGLDADSLVAATRRAIGAHHLGVPFELVRQRAMRVDVTLERTARLLERLYRTARVETEIAVAAS